MICRNYLILLFELLMHLITNYHGDICLYYLVIFVAVVFKLSSFHPKNLEVFLCFEKNLNSINLFGLEICRFLLKIVFSSVQSLSRVQLFATPWILALCFLGNSCVTPLLLLWLSFLTVCFFRVSFDRYKYFSKAT